LKISAFFLLYGNEKLNIGSTVCKLIIYFLFFYPQSEKTENAYSMRKAMISGMSLTVMKFCHRLEYNYLRYPHSIYKLILI